MNQAQDQNLVQRGFGKRLLKGTLIGYVIVFIICVLTISLSKVGISLIISLPGAIAGFITSLPKRSIWLRYGLFGFFMSIAIGVTGGFQIELGYLPGDTGIGLLGLLFVFPLPAFIVFSIVGLIVSKIKERRHPEYDSTGVGKILDGAKPHHGIPLGFKLTTGIILLILWYLFKNWNISVFLALAGGLFLLSSVVHIKPVQRLFGYFLK